MTDSPSVDWWMRQIYQLTKEYLKNPSQEMECKLKSRIAEYRAYHESRNTPPGSDEHEHLMDYQ